MDDELTRAADAVESEHNYYGRSVRPYNLDVVFQDLTLKEKAFINKYLESVRETNKVRGKLSSWDVLGKRILMLTTLF